MASSTVVQRSQHQSVCAGETAAHDENLDNHGGSELSDIMTVPLVFIVFITVISSFA